MSSAAATEQLSPAAAAFVAQAQQALRDDNHASLSDRDMQAVMTAAVRLYAARAEATRTVPPPLDEAEVSPTEVVVVASEMIRVVDLSPFDLSMWYRRGR
jgi:hypothetical protein